jgi:hypothetical protein
MFNSVTVKEKFGDKHVIISTSTGHAQCILQTQIWYFCGFNIRDSPAFFTFK